MGFPGRTVSIGALDTVIHARVDETLGMIGKAMEKARLLHQFGAGVVVTGGGARLRGVCDLAESVLGLHATIGKPRNVSGLATATEGSEYAACSGLVQYGFKTMMDEKKAPSLGGWFRSLFGR